VTHGPTGRITGVATLLIALLALAGSGSAEARGPLVTFHRDYGGIVGGSADLRIERDGRTAAEARPPGGCGDERRTFRLSAGQLQKLRADLRHARRKARPRKREQYSSEAPAVDITSGTMHLRYVGFGVAPPAAQPLIDRLDRIAVRNC
jgi:hypothetical protein